MALSTTEDPVPIQSLGAKIISSLCKRVKKMRAKFWAQLKSATCYCQKRDLSPRRKTPQSRMYPFRQALLIQNNMHYIKFVDQTRRPYGLAHQRCRCDRRHQSRQFPVVVILWVGDAVTLRETVAAKRAYKAHARTRVVRTLGCGSTDTNRI